MNTHKNIKDIHTERGLRRSTQNRSYTQKYTIHIWKHTKTYTQREDLDAQLRIGPLGAEGPITLVRHNQYVCMWPCAAFKLEFFCLVHKSHVTIISKLVVFEFGQVFFLSSYFKTHVAVINDFLSFFVIFFSGSTWLSCPTFLYIFFTFFSPYNFFLPFFFSPFFYIFFLHRDPRGCRHCSERQKWAYIHIQTCIHFILFSPGVHVAVVTTARQNWAI